MCKIKSELNGFYPRPLLIVLGNSVNTEDADIELFFKELVKIANKQFEDKVFDARKDLIDELTQAQCFYYRRKAWRVLSEKG